MVDVPCATRVWTEPSPAGERPGASGAAGAERVDEVGWRWGQQKAGQRVTLRMGENGPVAVRVWAQRVWHLHPRTFLSIAAPALLTELRIAMVDTVQLFQSCRVDHRAVPPGYRLTSHRETLSDGNFIPQNQHYDDPATGYHAYGENGTVTYHRASLPRLHHGTNGRLIKNQEELDAALALLQAKATELGEPRTPGFEHATRVDLVWQFKGDPAQFVLAHRNCRHPGVRSAPFIYENRSLVFKGSEVRISIYDKTRERLHRNGDIVRVDIQLKGDRLKEELGQGGRVTHLDFKTCYAAYRRIMLGFIPAAIPKADSIASLLAIGEREGWQANGIPAFDLYTAGLCERQVRRLRTDMAGMRATVHQIDWAALLPADGPPEPVELLDPV